MSIPDFNGYDGGYGPASIAGVVSFYQNPVVSG
jgi:hypothetical protein